MNVLFHPRFRRRVPSALGLLQRARRSRRLLLPARPHLALRQGSPDLGVLDVWISRDATWSYSFFQHLAYLAMLVLPLVLNRYINALVPGLLPALYVRIADVLFGGLYALLSSSYHWFLRRNLPVFHVTVVVYAILMSWDDCMWAAGHEAIGCYGASYLVSSYLPPVRF